MPTSGLSHAYLRLHSASGSLSPLEAEVEKRSAANRLSVRVPFVSAVATGAIRPYTPLEVLHMLMMDPRRRCRNLSSLPPQPVPCPGSHEGMPTPLLNWRPGSWIQVPAKHK